MLDETDLLWAEEADVAEDPRDTMPEMKHYLMQDWRAGEDASFRGIVEHPEACSRAWFKPRRGRPLYAA